MAFTPDPEKEKGHTMNEKARFAVITCLCFAFNILVLTALLKSPQRNPLDGALGTVIALPERTSGHFSKGEVKLWQSDAAATGLQKITVDIADVSGLKAGDYVTIHVTESTWVHWKVPKKLPVVWVTKANFQNN